MAKAAHNYTKSNQLRFILITLVLFQLHMRYVDLPTERHMYAKMVHTKEWQKRHIWAWYN